MQTEHRDESSIRLPLQEPSSFRGLPFITKAIAAYLRTLVDPVHGWLALRGQSVDIALRHNATGTFTRAETRVFKRSIEQLLDQGFLVRCRVVPADPGVIITECDREIALSSWIEDPDGGWVVIADWVAEQFGLSRADERAWHAVRREQVTIPVEKQQTA